MSFNGWKTADSDMHIMEPAKYLAAVRRRMATRRRSACRSCTVTCGCG